MKWLGNFWEDMSPALRRYYRASVLPSVLFVGLVYAHARVSERADIAWPLRAAVALGPVAAMAWTFVAYLHFLRDCDELERRIELGALAWSAGITVQAMLAALFLLDARVIDWRSDNVVALLGLVLLGSYAVVRAWLHRRYA
jgi:hypothetical protein